MTAATNVLTRRVYPVHAARHRATTRRGWLRRTAVLAALVFAGVTFLFGLVGWAALLTVAL